MKLILKSSAVTLLAVFVMSSCSKMEDNYKDWTKGGPIVYIGKVDSISVAGGYNRVQVTWNNPNDSRATKVTIFWANKTLSKTIPVENSEKQSVIIDQIEEGSFVCEVFTYDDQGNRSIRSEGAGQAYGDVTISRLQNRKPLSVVTVSNVTTITMNQMFDELFVKSTISYLDTNGSERTVEMDRNTNKAVLPDFNPANTSVKYKSTYLPEQNGIDELSTGYSTFTI